nr:hypothetical protein [Anaerolineaceae bacterium]
FSASDFDDSQNHTLARLLLQGLDQDEMDAIDYVNEHAEDEIIDRLTLITKGMQIQEKNEEKLLEDLYRTIVNLRLIRTNLSLNQLRFMESDEATEDQKASIQSMILQNTIARGKLDLALAKLPLKR